MACKWEQLGILCKGLRLCVHSGKLLLHKKFRIVFFSLQFKKVLLQMQAVLLRAKVYDLIKVELPSPEELPCTQLLLSHIQTCFLTHYWTIRANLVWYCQDSSLVPISLKRVCFRCLSPPTPHFSMRSPSITTSLLFISLCPHICHQKDEKIWKDHFQTKPVPSPRSALVH